MVEILRKKKTQTKISMFYSKWCPGFTFGWSVVFSPAEWIVFVVAFEHSENDEPADSQHYCSDKAMNKGVRGFWWAAVVIWK